jgi:hypothetical protein
VLSLLCSKAVLTSSTRSRIVFFKESIGKEHQQEIIRLTPQSLKIHATFDGKLFFFGSDDVLDSRIIRRYGPYF